MWKRFLKWIIGAGRRNRPETIPGPPIIHRMTEMQEETKAEYSPGAKVPYSGLYVVRHRGNHVPKHYVTILFGDVFPGCLTCSYAVRFELGISAVHVRAHPIFQ